uniref:Uncharacterized protein n=1 Tax=Trichinella nativa TaxID=6335 RepID=A0A0V1JXP6_9BILA
MVRPVAAILYNPVPVSALVKSCTSNSITEGQDP